MNLVISSELYIEEYVWGRNATVGQANSRRKTETLCWLYGHLARNCRLRDFRLIRPYQDDYRMYSVERRLELQEELLCESKEVYGVVTCSFAKPAR